jgi:hypothetical protein
VFLANDFNQRTLLIFQLNGRSKAKGLKNFNWRDVNRSDGKTFVVMGRWYLLCE